MPNIIAGSRAGGLHSRTIEVLDQRGIADRFLSQGQAAQIAGFAWIPLDISDFPTRHNYGLALWQNRIERILAGWVGELGVPIYRGREVTGFAQDDTGVDVALSDGERLRAEYLVGCDGGRSLIRKAAGIAFPGWDPTTSHLIAEVEMAEEPEWGLRRDALRIHSLKHRRSSSERLRKSTPTIYVAICRTCGCEPCRTTTPGSTTWLNPSSRWPGGSGSFSVAHARGIGSAHLIAWATVC